MGRDVQNQWVSLPLKCWLDKQEGLMAETDSKEMLPPGLKDLVFVCQLFI